MKQLRDLVSDLVQRRLWPVALALVVALVAVPVLIGRGGESSAPVAGVPGADAGSSATSEKAQVTLDTDAPAERPTADKVRDPFKAPAVHQAKTTEDDSTTPSAPAPSATSTPSAGASTGSSSGGASTGSSSTGAPTGSPSTGSTSTGGTSGSTKTKTKKTTAPTADDVSDTYHVSLRITVDGGTATTIRDIARLSPLPSVTDPFFVYLGVLQTKGDKPEKRAVFVVSSDATPNGEGACHPTKQDCETVELTVGQTAFFDYTAPDGKVTQYELELAGIHKTVVHAEAKAAAAFARHSVAGAELLRDAATRKVRAAGGARAYRYLPAVGLLVRAKRAKVTAKAAAAGEIPGIELVDRKHQPGLPVWHSPKK